MASLGVLLFTILTFSSQTFAQRLSFLRLPPSISLSSSSASTPLDADQLEPLIANLVGLPTDLGWSALPTFASLDRPKANLLFVVVEGGQIGSSSDLGFDDENTVQIDNANSESVFDSFRGLGLRLQSTFKDSPLLLTNPVVDDKPKVSSSSNSLDSGAVNGAMEFGQNAVNRLSGALKTSQALFPLSLNVSATADSQFFAELGEIQLLVDTLSNSAVQSLVKDATPDLFLFRFRSMKGVVEAYGQASPQVEEMKVLLKTFIEKVRAEVEKVYEDRVAVELITLPEAEAPLLKRRRRDATAAVNNLASPYGWAYSATMNMSIWTGVILIVVLYLIAYGMWNMDPGSDGVVYRMTMSKNK